MGDGRIGEGEEIGGERRGGGGRRVGRGGERDGEKRGGRGSGHGNT